MRFSKIEKEHLLKSWLAISFAFAVIIGNVFSAEFLIYFFISLITVGLGFLLHEMAHKFVAQKYGCWAEFRADDRMLLLAIFSAFLGFVFAAPGAVLISGRVTKEKNGKISIAGPLANLFLAFLFLFIRFLISFSFPITGILAVVLDYGYRINAFIGLFNMIPAMNFDGAKILRWNKLIYFITVGVFLVLVFVLPIFLF